MKRSVKKLRPKANKLLSFSANWKRSNKELNILLGNQIYELMETEIFPQSIELFFKIPMFKTILKNLRKGSLWKNVYVFTDEDHHPPKEIQKVQDIASAFQKACSLSHYPNYPHNPLSHAKILASDLHDHLLLIIKLKSFKGKASTDVKNYLLSKVEEFTDELKKIIAKHPKLFGAYKIPIISEENLATTYDIITYLHTLHHGKQDGFHLCHKILNQMHKQIEVVFDSISKNAPFYLPFAIRKVVYAKMKEVQTTKALHIILQSLFEEGRYEIIEAKQKSHLQNVKEACATLHILSKSLDKVAKNKDLPKKFLVYYHKYFLKILPALNTIENFNSQIGYFLSGFYETQISYLLELLTNPSANIQKIETLDIEHKIILFLEKYAKVKPELLQVDIKQAFTNPHIKDLSLEDAKAYVENTFSYLLPERNEDIFISLEKESKEILTKLLAIYKKVDQKTYLGHLLKEKIKGLYLIDVPSFSLGWYLFGEIVSLLYILAAEQHKKPLDLIEKFLIQIYQYPIFNVLLNAKHSELPEVFIRLKMLNK